MKDFKRKDISDCAVCGGKLMAKGSLTFYRLNIERLIFDVQAIREQHGLETMMGSPMLASVMGPDQNLALLLDGPCEVLVCENCAISPLNVCMLPIILEREAQKKAAESLVQPA